jgi:hypothetical protein
VGKQAVGACREGEGKAQQTGHQGRVDPLHDIASAEIAQVKQIAKQATSGGSDDDRPRFGQSLKTGCKIRRVPDHSVLPSLGQVMPFFLMGALNDSHAGGSRR